MNRKNKNELMLTLHLVAGGPVFAYLLEVIYYIHAY